MDSDGNLSDDSSPQHEYKGACKKLFPQFLNFDEVWGRLKEVVNVILAGEKLEGKNQKWNDSFIDVYNLCSALPKPYATELYNKVDECITNHVNEVHQKVQGKKGQDFLNAFLEQNGKVLSIANLLEMMFRHLNNYIAHQARELQIEELLSEVCTKDDYKHHNIGRLVMIRWKDKVLIPSGEYLSKLVLEQYDNYRNGKPIENADKLKACVEYYVKVESSEFSNNEINAFNEKPDELKLYKETFEHPLQQSCQAYYHDKANEWKGLTDSVAFIENVATLMESEKHLAESLMNASTVSVVEHWTADTLVADKVKTLKLSFKSHMTAENFNSQELRKCFNVLKLIDNGLVDLVKDFEGYILEYATKTLSKEASDPKVFVNCIAETHKKFDAITRETFDMHRDFCEIMDRALRTIVNGDKTSKAGDKLARYADAMLRKSATVDPERQSKNLGIALKYLTDKEQFEKPYQMLLANRLLGHMSAGELQEEAMVEMMKTLCGSDFVQKFIQMLQNVSQSSVETANYYKDNPAAVNPKFGIDYLLLRTGAWPLQIGNEIQGPFCPEEVSMAIQSFTSYYTNVHTGRKMTWAPSLSTVDVKLTYLDKTYTCTMTAIHYDIICCFEKNNSLSLNEVMELSRLTLDASKRYLKALFDNQILLCDDKDNLLPASVIKLNLQLSRRSNRMRLSIPMTNKPVKQEIRPEIAGSQNTQKYTIEACIVRIMKSKQKMKHQLLVAEIIDSIKGRFTPSTVVIKQCIESLIERVYLKRTEEMDEYEYIS